MPKYNTNAKIALYATFLFSLGSYILNPYFAVYVSENLAYGIAFSGMLITIKVSAQRAFVLFGGGLADRVGSVPTLRISMLIRILSFSVLILTPTKSGLICVALLNGIGSALFNPAARSFLYSQYRDDENGLKNVISLRNALFNAGTAIGPLIGLLLFNYSINTLCILSILMYASVFFLLFRAKEKAKKHDVKKPLLGDIFTFLSNKNVYPILLLQMGFSAIYSHFEYLLPIFLNKIMGNNLVQIAFTINAILVIVYQLLWKRYAHSLNFYILFAFQALFCLTMGLAFTDFFGIVGKYVLVIVGVILFTIAEVGMATRIDYITTKIGSENLGISFGWISLFSAGAVALANIINASFVTYFKFQAMWFLHVALIIIGVLLCMIFIKIKQLKNIKKLPGSVSK